MPIHIVCKYNMIHIKTRQIVSMWPLWSLQIASLLGFKNETSKTCNLCPNMVSEHWNH